MALSQKRASEVLAYVLETNLNGEYPWVRDHLQAVIPSVKPPTEED